MTGKPVADELDRVLGKASTKWWAIYGKLKARKLPPDQVLAALQAIHDGRFGQSGEDGSVVAPTVRQRPRLIHGLYTPPDQQLVNVRAWNEERHWGIPEAWFETLGPAPEWPTDSGLACVVLEVALPDHPEQKDEQGTVMASTIPGYIRTVRELWDMMSRQHPNTSNRWGEFHLYAEARLIEVKHLINAEHLELLDGVQYEPGLRWRILNLGANWDEGTNLDERDGIRPVDVRHSETSPNVDGFAALAHHPRFVRRMNGRTIPFCLIPGFTVSVPGHDPRWGVPLVTFRHDERLVMLGVERGDRGDPFWSVPARREWKRF